MNGTIGTESPLAAGDSVRPITKPADPRFSPGPTSKFKGWSLDLLKDASLGRSHRSKIGKAKLQTVITKSKAMLGMPADWRLGIMAGSDTGAVEAALWNMLGERGVDVLVWESFGNDWAKDAKDQLGLDDVRVLKADYGQLPDLTQVDFDRDVILTWNGTTSGVRLTDGDWIPDDRQGLVIADATSAAFAMDLPWDKLDVVTWSWQKVLGGEAAHGMLALSPRAVERIERFKPQRPIPKIYQLRKGDGLNEGIFEGATQNTPSLLAVEDCLAALNWAGDQGGLAGLVQKTNANAQVLFDWIERTPWVENLCQDPAKRSTTGVCLKVVDSDVAGLDEGAQTAFCKAMTKLLDAEGVAFDIDAYRAAPAGLRIWCGATIEQSDLEALTPWLDWAFASIKAETFAQKAA